MASYDPKSPGEQPVALPSAPHVALSAHVVLQPPLSRRSTGPGLVIFLPKSDRIVLNSSTAQPLDPQPVTKWAEEGFAIVGVIASEDLSAEGSLKQGLDALQALSTVDVKDKFGVIGRFQRSIYYDIYNLLYPYCYI